jgi:phosphoglycerate dehydrogenase-like enzyme
LIEVVLPHHLARDFGDQIEHAASGEVRLVATGGHDDVSNGEVAVSGWYERPFGEVLAAMPRLRWIHSTGSGMDDFVSPALAERDLLLTNAAGAYAPAMAEFALAAMVMLARDLPGLLDAQRERRWIERTDPRGSNLGGQQLGIVGYGAIGRNLATICKAVGMRVWATRRTPLFASAEPLDRLLPAEDLAALLAASDFVVIAASENTTTRGMLGEEELSAMKTGAFLVNVARGGLIDQTALAAALRSGKLGGAVLDVTSPEPLPPESELWDAPNLCITPHISGDTQQGWQQGVDFFCANLRQYVAGHPERMGNLVDIRAHL